jgi:S1-C subfamily serine protease
MSQRMGWILGGLGCGLVVLLVVAGAAVLFLLPLPVRSAQSQAPPSFVTATPVPGALATQEAVSPIPPVSDAQQIVTRESFSPLYEAVHPGVVNIRVYVQRQGMSGQGAGSGFVLDDAGHIVTNHHVVAEAERVTVLFYDSTEVEAEIVGTDPQSDLAVIRVASMPDGVKPLPLTNSDDVRVGDWVIAIGNPFGLGGSMTVGIVSATGRVIPAAVTSFSIPQAIQTDAAINPGNSGGPLLNTSGEVIGVNAQIVSPGGQTNAGVGFAIPANIVRRVAPVLIDHGTYQWPWLGVRGTSLDLALAEANNLDTQKGAYIHEVILGGPAAQAGLQGSSGTTTVSGIQVPTGGDVVVAVNGEPVVDWSDLLANIALRSPGDRVTLTVIRDGQRTEIPVELEARSASQSD